MRLILVLMLATALGPAWGQGMPPPQKLSKQESRCLSRCDLMRYQCSQGGNQTDACVRGRDACMDRCMGRPYSEEKERERQQRERNRIEVPETD